MFHDRKHGMQILRRRMAQKFQVNILAKLWVRSKQLRELRTYYLRRKTAPRMPPRYRLLDDGEIRLLRIKPGGAFSTIECSFLYTDMRTAGEYVALSYTWGTAAPSIPIMVDRKVSLVAENLYLALLHLRQRGITLVWVDALCINQEDLSERARQVAQMKSVYCWADSVLIWLGDSNELTERAFDEMHGLCEYFDYDGIISSQHSDALVTGSDHRKWEAISEVLCRPWFRRVWIIQEALSARRATMVCGKDSINLLTFLRIINSMLLAGALRRIMTYHPKAQELSLELVATVLHQLDFLVMAKFNSTNAMSFSKFKPTLLNYLAGTRWAEATNPLDKVYGILSLADDAHRLGYWEGSPGAARKWTSFQVDYTLTQERLFINVTKAILCTTKSLDVLRFSEHDPNSGDALPSWVPNWANKTPHRVFDHTYICPLDDEGTQLWRPRTKPTNRSTAWDSIYRDITHHCPPTFHLGTADTLHIKGVHFDTITGISTDPCPNSTHHWPDPQNETVPAMLASLRTYLENLRTWTATCVPLAEMCSPYPTGGGGGGQSAWTAFYRTLNPSTSSTGDASPPKSFEALLDDMSTACSALGAAETAHPSLQTNDPPDPFAETGPKAVQFLIHAPNFASACYGRKFAATRKKYMGMVPEGAETGDMVCFLYGCETAFVLRDCGGDGFKVVGNGEFTGLLFDDAVVESGTLMMRGKYRRKERFDFVVGNGFHRDVGVRLRESRMFELF